MNPGNADAVPRMMFGSRIYLPMSRNVSFDPRIVSTEQSLGSTLILGTTLTFLGI